MAAFDRRHLDKFRRQFLGTLRAAGNRERVVAVGYGLYPSEISRLAQLDGVDVLARPAVRDLPPIARLRDFPIILDKLHPATPVAYWDAGDVFFQGRLEALWRLVQEQPGKLLAVREPTGYPRNPAVAAWTLSIADSAARQRAWRLMQERPFLNSGFAAGTAEIMRAYFREAHRLRHSSDLLGSTDWGDQMALNLFCHSEPARWQEISEGWNFCVHDRSHGQLRTRPDGRLINRAGSPIHVIHGNAHSYRHQELLASYI